MSRKEDLEESIRESCELVGEYETKIRLSDDPKVKTRAKHEVAEQRMLLRSYIADYRNVCAALGNCEVPDDIAEIAASIDGANKQRQDSPSAIETSIEPLFYSDPPVLESRVGTHLQTDPVSHPASPASGSVIDYVIVAPLEEERNAILSKLPGYQRLPPDGQDIRYCFRADLHVRLTDNSEGTLRLVVVSPLGMGRVQAATVTADAIRRWRPRCVLLVGIAGGVASGGVRLGDVLVATQIADYELQKVTSCGAQVRWEVYRTEPKLLGAAQVLDAGWLGRVQTPRPVAGNPKRHIGPVASGDKVIAVEQVLEAYRQDWPKLIGVEMEAGGAAAAAFQAADPPGFFMVRGVSDLADEQKGTEDVEKWRVYACDVAASYAVALLAESIIPSPPPPPIPETVLVPAGEFLMGCSPADTQTLRNEASLHPVYLPAFRIGKYPVTNAEYEAFCLATRRTCPEHWVNGQIPAGKERHPVVNVNYEDARVYCEWLTQTTGESFRLPTEEEWEKAARGEKPEMRCYPWGDDWGPTKANTKHMGNDDTTPVDAFVQTNLSPFGAVDMVGNVWEWTSTLYKRNHMVVRGGSWDYPRDYARISCRGRDIVTVRKSNIGFRIVCSVGG